MSEKFREYLEKNDVDIRGQWVYDKVNLEVDR